MTILLAVAHVDSLLFMADGRTSNKSEGVVTDNAEKVIALRSNLLMAVCGASIGTEMAKSELRKFAPGSASDLLNQMSELVVSCASHVSSLITPATRCQAHVKVGLLAGGFDPTGSFLAGALFGDGMTAADSLLVRPSLESPQFMVMGGEEVGAQADFAIRLSSPALQGLKGALRWPLILDAGLRTIRTAAERDSTIGGRVQYWIQQRGSADVRGFL